MNFHTSKEQKSREDKQLSSREIEVLKLVVKGNINKEIADILSISFNTVLTHRKNISSEARDKVSNWSYILCLYEWLCLF